ncbi:flavoprotein [Streptomyces sp. WMMB 322]|uniref:flavoprotein n=1 Tax=Streptomyces sp. WMMB 322 TaxID=1286821 RepID=UPI0006E433E4|nr:flavoprotein [Streptomyces sp. WMMB 322]SCK58927.1 Flavoprotein [Streptomyces sp. WMMB 322]
MAPPVLHLLASAAPPVVDLVEIVRRAKSGGWTVCVGLTPTAAEWMEGQLSALEEQTGHPVRSTPRRFDEREVWPGADVTVLAPATLNTVNSSALGLTTNFVTGRVVEAVGKRWPLVMMPCVNSAYATHPQFATSIETLRNAGVHVLYGEGGFEPDPPGEGDRRTYPWALALDAARSLAGWRRTPAPPG